MCTKEERVSSLLLGLAVLACPVGMGLMMWMMMRGSKSTPTTEATNSGGEQQLGQLRAEIDQFKADRAKQRAPGGQR